MDNDPNPSTVVESDLLTERIIACCYAVHNQLGSGFLESVYRKALVIELRQAGLRANGEVPLSVRYRGQEVGQFFADLLVEDSIICELKACDVLLMQHEAQLVNYLQATGTDIGLLINFGDRVTVKRKWRVPRQKLTQSKSGQD